MRSLSKAVVATGIWRDNIRHMPATISALSLFDDARMALEVERGLSVARFFALRETLEISQEKLAKAIDVPMRTLQRRQSRRDRLKCDESERLLRLMRIEARARQIFGCADRVREWMFSDNVALGGRSPFAFAATEPGAREVERVLGRIEHGVFS